MIRVDQVIFPDDGKRIILVLAKRVHSKPNIIDIKLRGLSAHSKILIDTGQKPVRQRIP